ncbi:unnamed protein product [Echinostoma caproni]|uniref:Uncharacterized protein n=1 Tax=Echinostoma caproni TaxID=27848 RepID=A0A183A3X7_9TREM|nr:unnamed protein product [Echinostoma caproni]
MYSESLYCTENCKRTRFEEQLAVESVQAPSHYMATSGEELTFAKDGTLAEKDEDKTGMVASHCASVYTPDFSPLAHLLDTDTALTWTPFTIGKMTLELRLLKVHQSPRSDYVHPADPEGAGK